MKIIVVGAGLGGLSAALCFARRGHSVQVLEARPTLSPSGGGINIRPGASRILHSWGLRADLEKIGEPTRAFLLRNMNTGDITMRNITYDTSDEIDWGTTRERVMHVLYDRAQEAGAEILFDCPIVNTTEDADRAWVETKDRRKFSADLLLAADGIRSHIRPQILSDLKTSIEPIISDTTFYGVKVRATDLEARSDTERLLDKEHSMVWQGKDGFVVTRHNPKLNSNGGLFGIKSENDMKGLWDEKGDMDFVRGFFSKSCEELRALLEVGTSCDRWKLAEMPDLPRWTSLGGRVVLLGDSAHAMEPNAAQGYSMIVEDIGVLEYLIEQDPNASANMRDITDTWQKIRKPRVERIKAYAKENTRVFLGEPMAHRKRRDTAGSSAKSLKDVTPRMDARFTSSAFVKWTMNYDVATEVKNFRNGNRARL